MLADPRIEIYSCGRTDIESGQIDRRMLAMLEYLAERGYRLTITSLKCGHSFYTTSGNVSAHSSGNAVDIAAGQRPARSSATRARARSPRPWSATCCSCRARWRPTQIITPDGLRRRRRFAMGDHDDHIHVGYTPLYGAGRGLVSSSSRQILKPEQWERLIDRLGEIENPTVPTKPSDASLPAGKGKGRRASRSRPRHGAHRGE